MSVFSRCRCRCRGTGREWGKEQTLKSRIALARISEFDGLSSWGKKSQRIKTEKNTGEDLNWFFTKRSAEKKQKSISVDCNKTWRKFEEQVSQGNGEKKVRAGEGCDWVRQAPNNSLIAAASRRGRHFSLERKQLATILCKKKK